tara:strand:- start:257 stop:856 length:600 start_codon:yes stop_codon:yes gene_type:complete
MNNKNIGLDFDNTLINYDVIFHKTAVEKGLIPESVSKNKVAVRDFLRFNGNDNQFTLLQGEVYGNKIKDATISLGCFNALKYLTTNGYNLYIVSHKTKTPIKGYPYDLHKAALNWLELNKFFSEDGLNIRRENVYFEESKKSKIKRIISISCSYYIDDLIEILELIPNNIIRFHYDPQNNNNWEKGPVLNQWENINNFL